MASAKVNDRGSFGSKRSRNDVPKKDGDWTCPKCGNVNFSFRTVCNRGKCGTARPSASPQRMGSVTLPYTYGHAPPVYFGGAEVRPAVPFGMPSGYGPPLSHPGMRYDYGLHGGAAGPYAVLSPFPPPGPTINGYGIGFRGSPLPVLGSWFEEGLSDNNASRKRRGGPDGVSEGDWVCPKCDNVNFSFRTTCNMKKCGTPRPTPGVKKPTSNNNEAGAPEGSWTCTECGNLNYPFRTECNRKGCGKEKPSSG